MAAIRTGMAPMQQNYASIARFGKDGAGRVEQSEQPVSPPESPQKPLHDERHSDAVAPQVVAKLSLEDDADAFPGV
jgi:hypothetical protein